MQGRAAAFVVVVLIGVAGIVSSRFGPAEAALGFVSQGLSSVQQFMSDPLRQTNDFFRTVQEMGDLRAENARLHDEIGRLRGEAARNEELQRTNDQLLDQLNLKRSSPSYQWQTARVIGRDGSNLLRSVTIDRGSADNIAMGMTVISPAGLVGQVVRVGPHTARVLLITDVSSSVTALIQGSRTEGVVNGEAKNYLVMSYIPQPAVIKTGDRVITSGIGGIFPNGIPIGEVTMVSKKDVELFQEARIEPGVDFQRLETVLVLTNHVPLRLE